MTFRDGNFFALLLIWCHVLLENSIVRFDLNFSFSRTIDFLGQESQNTHNPILWTPISQLILPHHLSTKGSIFRKWHLSSFGVVIRRHGKRIFVCVFRVFLFIAWSLWGFVSLSVNMFCLRMDGGRSVALFMWVPSRNTLTFISQQVLFPSWLSVTDPRSSWILISTSPIIWSLWSFAAVFNCWWFSGLLFRATSWSLKAITIWSWTEFCDFELCNPSRIDGENNFA